MDGMRVPRERHHVLQIARYKAYGKDSEGTSRGRPLKRLSALVVLVTIALSLQTALILGDERQDGPRDGAPPAPAEVPATDAGIGGTALEGPMVEPFFMENRGQLDDDLIRLYSVGEPLSVGLGPGWAAFELVDLSDGREGAASVTYRMTFEGARAVEPVGRDDAGHRVDRFVGDDPSRWMRGVECYREVLYAQLYEGIDLVFRLVGGELKYEFLLSPGADPAIISLGFEGHETLGVDAATGDLMVATREGTVRDSAPSAFQGVGDARSSVPCAWSVRDGRAAALTIGGWDASIPLTIDPGIVFCDLFGGSGDDQGFYVLFEPYAPDATDGFYYISGQSRSPDFNPSWDPVEHPGGWDVFVCIVNGSGSHVARFVLIGGSGDDWTWGHALVPSMPYMYCKVFVTGKTSSTDFPTTEDAWSRQNSGGYDAFLVCLDLNAEDMLEHSTLFGGSEEDRGVGICVAGRWDIYVAGTSWSDDFPTTPGAYDTTNNGRHDVFVVRFNGSNPRSPLFSTLVGGSDWEGGEDLCIDAEGCCYVSGHTMSADFPTTAGAYDRSHNGMLDAFAFKLDPGGQRLLWSTFLGGRADDQCFDLCLGEDGSTWITGSTTSIEFPQVGPTAGRSHAGADDLYVAHLEANGTGVEWSTLLGGNGDDWGVTVVTDGQGGVLVAGKTQGHGFPTTPGAFDREANGSYDGLVLKLGEGGVLLYSSFYGGSSWDYAYGIAVGPGSDIILTGWTNSTDFPVKGWGWYQHHHGVGDVFLLRANITVGRPEPVRVPEGPRLYARYKAYDIVVDANPFRSSTLPSGVLITLDPGGADVGLRCERSPGGWLFQEERDPSDLVELSAPGCHVTTDAANGTAALHFLVTFEWEWPHEEPCDVAWCLPVPGGGGGAAGGTTINQSDLFSVENDLVLSGGPSVVGEWQGPVPEGGWVRAMENVTVTGLSVVYEGTTDLLVPDGTCALELRNDDGEVARTPIQAGAPVGPRIRCDASTDLEETVSLALVDLPPTVEARGGRTLHLSVDGDPPVLRDPVPGEDEWQATLHPMVAITADDGATSGVDAGSLEYSVSRDGGHSFTAWGRGGLGTHDEGIGVEGLVTVDLHEGVDNLVRWQVKDRVGNGARSADLRVLVDVSNVTFRDPFPTDWQTARRVECGVVIEDVGGSPVAVPSVMYRISSGNLSHYGAWRDYDEGSQRDDVVVLVRVNGTFAESGHCYIQWRAMDVAGNGLMHSPHYRVMVDTTPIEFLGMSPAPGTFLNRSRVECWVTATDGAAGSGVELQSIEYRYGPEGGDPPEWLGAGLTGERNSIRFSTVLDLPDGTTLVQFRGHDVAMNPTTESEWWPVAVDTAPPAIALVWPPRDQRQTSSEVEVRFELSDALSGLDTTAVRLRWGAARDLDEVQWTQVEAELDGDGYVVVRTVGLDPGADNWVQLSARDRASNEGISPPEAIWVNRPPVAVIASPLDLATIPEGGHLELRSGGSTDPDGDAIVLTWYGDWTDVPLLNVSEGSVDAPVGVHVISLEVTDPYGASDGAYVAVTVLGPRPPRTASDGDLLLWMFLIVVIAILVSGLVVRRLLLVRE